MPLVTLTPFNAGAAAIPATAYFDYMNALSPIAYWRLGETVPASIDDDFTGVDGDAPNTELWNPPTYDPSMDPGTVPGTVTIQNNTLDAAISNDIANTVISSIYWISGDFDIQVDYSMDSIPPNTFAFGLNVNDVFSTATFATSYAMMARYNVGFGPYRSNTTSGGTAVVGGPNDTFGKFRMTRTGSSISTFYWDNVSAWVPFATKTYVSNSVLIKLFTRTWDSNQTLNVNYDNFIVNSGSILAPVAVDETGTYHGTYQGLLPPSQNDAGLITADVNTAAGFDHTLGQQVNCGETVGNAGIRTVVASFKLNSAFIAGAVDYQAIFVRWDDDGDGTPNEDHYGFYLDKAAGHLVFMRYEGNDSSVSIKSDQASWNANQTYHIIATIDSIDGMMMLVDGVKQQNTHVITTPVNIATTSDSTIGSFGEYVADNRVFDGVIDEVILYTTALTQSEAEDSYRLSKGWTLTPANYQDYVLYDIPVAYWRLGEASTTDFINGDSVATNVGFNPTFTSANIELTNGNLTARSLNNGWKSTVSDDTVSAGEVRYLEYVVDTTGSNWLLGFSDTNAIKDSFIGAIGTGFGVRGNSGAVNFQHGLFTVGANMADIIDGDIIGMSLQHDDLVMKLYKNGVLTDTFSIVYQLGVEQPSTPMYIAASIYSLNIQYTLRLATAEMQYAPNPLLYTPATTYKTVDELGNYHGRYHQLPVLETPGLLINNSDTSVTFNSATTAWMDSTNNAAFNRSIVSMAAFIKVSSYPASKATIVGYASYTDDVNLMDKNMSLEPDGTITFYTFDGTQVYNTTTGIVPLNTIVFIVATVSDTTSSVYINSNLDNTIASAGSHAGYADATVYVAKAIGSSTPGTAYFNGIIDEVAVFNHVLTPTEITDLYLSSIGFDPNVDDYKNEVLSLAPIAYWRLGETEGTLAADELLNNNGTYTNAPTLGATSLIVNDGNPAVTFNGINQYVSIGTGLNNQIGTGDMSVTYVVNHATTADFWRTVQNRGTGATTSNLPGFQISGGNDFENTYVQTSANNFVKFDSTLYITGSVTYHITVTYKKATAEFLLYIDGIFKQTGAITGTPQGQDYVSARSLTLAIAENDLTQDLNGTLDEVAIFDKVLTPTEITDLYQKSIGN